ncbi:hypothetical protein ABIC49_003953 [Burkholderia ambifaria]
MCAYKPALTPTLSRKPSPVRIYSVSDSSRRVAGCADSQIFACARHVRNLLPYRLTFRFVVILRLRFRVLVTGSLLGLTAALGWARTGLYACTGMADRETANFLGDPEIRAKKALCRVDPSRFAGPGAHCTAHRNSSVPKILTSPARNSVNGMPRNPRHTWDQPPGPPEKSHLIEKSGAPTDAKAAPEKSHRNRRGIKNVNGIRYLCAAGVRVDPAIIPRKTSPFRHPAECDSCLSAPENSHLCQKVAQRKSDFGQSGRAFQRIFAVMAPEKPHL